MAASTTTDSHSPLGRGIDLERTFAGLEVRLRVTGWGRFGPAAFLAFWLCGWAAGEGFALWLVGAGAYSVVTGAPLGRDGVPLQLWPALAVGAFILCWLAFWTLGGFAAMYEFGRLLWGRDRLAVTAEGLTVEQRAGLFHRRRTYALPSLRRLHCLPRGPALRVETTAGVFDLTRLGSLPDLEVIGQLLADELKLPPADRLPPILPPGWSEAPAPTGGTLLTKTSRGRGIVTAAMWILALAVSLGAAKASHVAAEDATLLPLALLAGAATLALVWAAIWWSGGRIEWVVQRGRIARERHFFRLRRTTFMGEALVLSEHSDSDGDVWYTLAARGRALPRGPREAERTLLRVMHDPTAPRQLARWLVDRGQLPFVDQTGHPPDPAKDLAATLATLRAGGRWSRAFASVLERLARGQRRSR